MRSEELAGCAPVCAAPKNSSSDLSIPPPLVRHTSRGRKRTRGGRHDTAHFQTDREIICRIGPGRPRSVDSLWKSAMGGCSAQPPPRPDGRGEPWRTPSGPVGGIARPLSPSGTLCCTCSGPSRSSSSESPCSATRPAKANRCPKLSKSSPVGGYVWPGYQPGVPHSCAFLCIKGETKCAG